MGGGTYGLELASAKTAFEHMCRLPHLAPVRLPGGLRMGGGGKGGGGLRGARAPPGDLQEAKEGVRVVPTV